ncbi:MAG TPA: TA system VapC family ribonuclease toxin [Actinomycetota bacterium]|nr:TA system VapC family ribonuclease toxin [Actinomycetota bacterium]
MVLVDANVLLYAANTDARQHVRARAWVEPALNGDEPVGFAWVVVLAFLRIATLPAFAPHPLSVPEAFDLVDEWLAASASVVVEPTFRHAAVLRQLLAGCGTGGNLVTDAHLAALAVEHKARVCSFDRDFARFGDVQCFSP